MSISKSALLAAASAIALITAAPAVTADDKRYGATTNVEYRASSEIKADTLVGKDLKSISGDTIGDIESVIIDDKGKVTAVIVGVGGFLGIGEREVAIDWNDLRLRGQGDDVHTNLTKNDLKALPEYKYEKPEYRKRAFLDRRYVDRRHDMRDTRAATMDRKATMLKTKAEWVPATGMRVSKLVGANVVNTQGETIGEVEDLVMVNGQTRLILSVGEFLGMGGHDVAIDLDKAKIHQQRGDMDDLRVAVSMSKEQLKALPKFDLDGWKKRSNKG